MLLRFSLLLFVILMLQSSCYASDDDVQDDDTSNSHEIVDSFPKTYDATPYAWRLWNFPYYQPRVPQIPGSDGGGSPPLADPRFVTNRCNSRQTYTATTTYPCYTYTTFITAFFTFTTTSTTTTTVTTTAYPSTTTPSTTPFITDSTTAATSTTTQATG